MRRPALLRALCALVFVAVACGAPEEDAAPPGGEAERPAGAGGAEGPGRAAEAERPGGGDAAAPDTVSGWTAGIVRTEPRAPDPAAGRDSAPEPGDFPTLQAVRVEPHEGFDRVIFDLSGSWLPGLHVEYVDEPVRECGSGHPVELPGDGWLELRLHEARAHTEQGEPTVDEDSVRAEARAAGAAVIRELALTCDFEAIVTWVLAVSSPNRYRVLTESSPPRVVVDVRH